MDFINQMKEESLKINIELSSVQLEQFYIYYENLIETNKVMNLTSITEQGDVIRKHFMDSLALVNYIDFSSVQSVIDIGTGAGFPGIPLAIYLPEVQFTLLDSLNKRIIFIQNVIEKMGIKNVIAIHGRAEEYARQEEYREKYHFAVSRAVANLATLSEYCIPFVEVGGSFISYKAGDIEEEVKLAMGAIEKLGGSYAETKKFNLLDLDIARSFVKIEKEKKTIEKYPRGAGKPLKKPLS